MLDESTSALDPDNEEMLYQTMRSLKIHFISVGHRSQLKAFHDQLVVFDGKGRFTASLLQAVPLSLAQAHDHLPSSALLSKHDTPSAPTEPEAPSPPLFPLFRLCFLRRESAKNLFLHFVILLLVINDDFLSIVWVKNAVVASYTFTDTSFNAFLQYFLVAILAASASATIINALIAYVALRTRKSLCREMHGIYFTGNTCVLHLRPLSPPPPAASHALHTPPPPPSPPQLLQTQQLLRRHA